MDGWMDGERRKKETGQSTIRKMMFVGRWGAGRVSGEDEEPSSLMSVLQNI